MTEKTKQPGTPAIKSKSAIILVLAVTIFAAAADLWSKHAVFNWLLGSGSEYATDVENDAEYLKSLKSPQIPPADSQDFSRLVLQRMKIQKDFIPGLQFTISTNPGVVFGFNALHRNIVNLATVVMIIAVGIFFAVSSSKDRWLHIAFGLILGGAIGNLYDRLFSYVYLPGLTPIRYHVRDFIDCSEIGYRWVFNVADAWLVIGVAMIMIHTLWAWRKEMHSKKKGQTL